MTSAAPSPPYHIYPPRYYDAAPTWFAWNKLTAADVYALRQERGFEGQNIYFWLNHPIQYIRLVGLVVQIDLVGSGRYLLLTLDDSSGANIEVKIEKRQTLPGDSAEYPSNTLVDNVDVLVNLGNTTVLVDKRPVELGDIIRAQGTLTTFRGDRQLDLKRIGKVLDTNEEAIHWSNAAEWKRSVLNKPWILTKQQRDAIEQKLQDDRRKERKRARLKHELRTQHGEKSEKREQRRKQQEDEMNAGALQGSEVLPMPWD